MAGLVRWWRRLLSRGPRVGVLLATLVAAPALAGCADAPSPGLVTVPLVEPRAALRDACLAVDCSWEWVNLTVEGEGRRALRVPLPLVHGAPSDTAAWDLQAWARNLTADGAAASVVGGPDERAFVQVEAAGPVQASTHRVRVAGPTGHAEDFLLARWGPTANLTRPTALDARLAGAVEGVLLTYEARGALCERRASFSLDARDMDGVAWMPGRDEVTCR